MNPRRVHELMRQSFPELDTASAKWNVAVDESGLRCQVLDELLTKHIEGDELLIEVSRRIGDLVPRHAAAAFIASHLGRGNIRITNRSFTVFVVLATAGVATGWSKPSPGSADRVQPAAPKAPRQQDPL